MHFIKGYAQPVLRGYMRVWWKDTEGTLGAGGNEKGRKEMGAHEVTKPNNRHHRLVLYTANIRTCS